MAIPLTDPDDLHPVGRTLHERGVNVTLTPYPGVPRDQIGFRVQVTAANTGDQIDTLLETLSWLAGSGNGAQPVLHSG